MNNLTDSLLLPGERIKSRVTGTFELDEGVGICFVFGTLIATDSRLIWLTKYPFAHKEIIIHQYTDISHIDIIHSSFSFHKGVTMKGNWVTSGDMKDFLQTIKFCSLN